MPSLARAAAAASSPMPQQRSYTMSGWRRQLKKVRGYSIRRSILIGRRPKKSTGGCENCAKRRLVGGILLTRYLLDSNVVMYWLNGVAQARALLAELNRRRDLLAVNAVSVAETYSGVPPEDLGRVNSLLGAFRYWPIDWAVARLAGEYRHKYGHEGRKLPVPDVILGAHAISEDATLITNNERDFPMPELKILIYRDWTPGPA